MSRDTVFSLGFAVLFAGWFVGYASGARNWLITVGGYAFGAVFGLVALAVVVFAVLWVLRMLGVVARLPWTLERKLTDRR